MAHELNVLALVKGTVRYVFVYDDASRAQLIDSLRDQAADPNLDLTWFDALVLTRKAREQEQGSRTPAIPSHLLEPHGTGSDLRSNTRIDQ